MEAIVETWELMVDMGVDGVTGPVFICYPGVLKTDLDHHGMLTYRGSHANHNDTCCLNPVAMADVSKMSAMGRRQGVGTEQDWASVDLPHWHPRIWIIMVVCGSCGCFLLEGHCSAAGSVVYNMAALLHVCNFHIVGLME
ncbi:unnamed protein product [Arctogadus glacialis]